MSVLFPVEDGSIALYMHAATQEGREREAISGTLLLMRILLNTCVPLSSH